MQTPRSRLESMGDHALLRDQLNEQQFDAVTTLDGPVLVIAGAGSGKTRTLVYRVANLIQSGVAPERILLLTFTRKASQEMLWRAGRLLGDSCGRVTGGTFHGVANMLLRRYSVSLGYGTSFTIIDRADAEGIINLLKTSLGLKGRDKQFPSKRVIINMISGAVNKSRNLEDLVFEQYVHLSQHLDDILTLQKHYSDFKINHGLMDYDDLLVNWKRLLQQDDTARREISARFSHIMVDEYQDTNLVQADIVRLLAQEHSNVMVVGDDAQSIYSFRGADFHNIMRFPRLFAGTRIIKLEENYRSTQPILTLTNDIIKNAAEKYTKTLFSRIESDRLPEIFAGHDERAEARFVVQKIEELQHQGISLDDMAVLFRSGFHSYKLEVELTAGGYDFEKRGGLKLTESAHMKDVLSFLRLIANPRDTLSWNRILLQLEKIGPKIARKIAETVVEQDDPLAALARYPAAASWKEGLDQLALLFQRLRKEESMGLLFELIMQYYEPFFQKLYRDDYPKRQKDLDQLKGILTSYEDLQSFIDEVTLDPPEAENTQVATGNRLVLSTIHSAKGLEWEVVFVIGLAEGRFPHAAAVIGDQWEEERRLFYVAATRAKSRLFLCYPKEMMSTDRRFSRVGMSPFLRELGREGYRIAGDSVAVQREAGFDPPSPRSITRDKRPRLEIDDFSPGCRVRHPFFGAGIVKKLSKPRTLDIHFDRHGVKTLHLDYAKLEIVQ